MHSLLFGCRRHLSPYEKAALIVDHAMHGRPVMQTTSKSLYARRIYHYTLYRYTYIMVCLLHMGIAFAEPATGGALPQWWIALLDFMALAIYASDITIQWLYMGSFYFRRKRWGLIASTSLIFSSTFDLSWFLLKFCLLPCLVLNSILSASIPAIPNVFRAARPVFLIERMRNVRKIAGNIGKTIPKILNVAILMALLIVFFGVLAFVLFDGVVPPHCYSVPSDEFCSPFLPGGCENYFSTLENSILNLFVLSTTANFPDVSSD